MKKLYKRELEDAKAMDNHEVVKYLLNDAREKLNHGEKVCLVVSWDKPEKGEYIEEVISDRERLEQIASAYEFDE